MKNSQSPSVKSSNPIEAYYRARERLRWNSEGGTESLSARVKNSLEKTLKNNRRPAASVRLSLWEQRKQITPLLQKSTSVTQHILSEQKGREGSWLRVYLERAFSNPADYQFPVNPLSLGEKQEVLRYLVLDPSRISDSLFLDLTGISESDWTIKTQAEQMEMKRSYIPYFKQLFTDSFQLLTHVGAGTGRIARLPFHPLMPHIAGQYLVFQELQSLDIRRIHARESRKNNISVKLLPDIWSLARSQEYAGEAMSRKISLIQDCKSELMGIRVRYPDANEIERRETIAEFIKKFSQKQAYAFKKIITVRKPKLRYTNVGIDSAVLMGMSNDLDRYYYEIVSKWTQIQRQALLIRNMADVHAVQFHRFLDALHTEFSQFDSSDMERRILDTVESEKEFGFVGSESFKIGKIWHHAKLYRDILSLPVSTGAPFFEIENRVIHAISKVRMSSPKTNVRELLKLVVYSKLAAYEIALRQIRDGLRTEKIALMRDVYLDRLQRTIDILGSLHFLKGIKFDKFDIEFEKKLASLQTIFGLLQSGKFDLAHDLVKTLVGR